LKLGSWQCRWDPSHASPHCEGADSQHHQRQHCGQVGLLGRLHCE
jgi:hypothetical protein